MFMFSIVDVALATSVVAARFATVRSFPVTTICTTERRPLSAVVAETTTTTPAQAPSPVRATLERSSSSLCSTTADTAASTREDVADDAGDGPLSLTLDELGDRLQGKGRARATWDCYRVGAEPLAFYDAAESDDDDDDNASVRALLPPRRRTEGLGARALRELARVGGIEERVATISRVVASADGTTKLLVRLNRDGAEVETVVIPWYDRGSSTLCVSSQVGCRMGCTFCATGRMGRARSLSADEILAQLFLARRVVRRSSPSLPDVDNVVFMGMGEPADNADAVRTAVAALVDNDRFGLAPSRVTVSTVAPDPDAFARLAYPTPVAVAWSVHAADDATRRRLVPTARHDVDELANGLVEHHLSKGSKSAMLEVVLVGNGVNDSVEDAVAMRDLCRRLKRRAPDARLMVNLIPYNDINNGNDFDRNGGVNPSFGFERPSPASVAAFQKVLTDDGVLTFVRTTRGDDENAACGQLATNSGRRRRRKQRDDESEREEEKE